MAGSPPRLWGILSPGQRFIPILRFTPTPVGNTSHSLITFPVLYGSPPRLWGIRPAHRQKSSAGSVHPHACGEYGQRSAAGQSEGRFTPTPVGNTIRIENGRPLPSGSPPRLWGIPAPASWPVAPTRFTPTPVGNTQHPAAQLPAPVGSPPRLWGIRRQSNYNRYQYVGSPPRLWGILHVPGVTASNIRFTPTPVGNTLRAPRMRRPSAGSPPRLWGIPGARDWSDTVVSVHPHACGEY